MPGAFAVARDLGPGGCGVVSPAPLGTGSLLKLYMSFDSEILEANARVALARALPLFFPPEQPPSGIHPSAVISETARVDPTAQLVHRARGYRLRFGKDGVALETKGGQLRCRRVLEDDRLDPVSNRLDDRLDTSWTVIDVTLIGSGEAPQRQV